MEDRIIAIDEKFSEVEEINQIRQILLRKMEENFSKVDEKFNKVNQS